MTAQLAGTFTAQSPASIFTGITWPGERRGCLVVGPLAPLVVQRGQLVHHEPRLVDRVHRAALAPVAGCSTPAWPRRPSTVIVGITSPRTAVQTSKEVGSGISPAVGPHAVRHGGDAPGAGALLVGHGADVSAPREPGHARHRLRGDHHRGHAALHVARAAADQAAAANLGAERVGDRPGAERPGGDHVHVPVEHQRRAVVRAREGGRQLRLAAEAEAGGHLAAAREDRVVRLPQVGPRAGAVQPLAQVLLEGGLLARLVARPWCRRRSAPSPARPARRGARPRPSITARSASVRGTGRIVRAAGGSGLAASRRY